MLWNVKYVAIIYKIQMICFTELFITNHHITSNHRKTGVNIVVLVNRFRTSSVKCWAVNFCIHASKGPVVIMRQLKFIYNSPFKDSYSRPKIFSIPCGFLEFFGKIIGWCPLLDGWRPLLPGILNPPLQTTDNLHWQALTLAFFVLAIIPYLIQFLTFFIILDDKQ